MIIIAKDTITNTITKDNDKILGFINDIDNSYNKQKFLHRLNNFESSIIEQQNVSSLQHAELERWSPIKVFKGSNFKPNNKPKKVRHQRKNKRNKNLDYE